MKCYKVFQHGSRIKPAYSINQVDSAGKYICQQAFWFKSEDAARVRAAELVNEDNEEQARFVANILEKRGIKMNPCVSVLMDGCGVMK